jgi:8-oxo-dGTP pyrophosphatase MutT (NUDIX family)
MLSGKTILGNNADGGIVIVYYIDRLSPIFLMGQETTFLTEVHNMRDFKTKEKEDIWKAFLNEGDINNKKDLDAAKKKFTKICKEIEEFNPRFIKHITFSDLKNSKASPGNISAKPRCVKEENIDRYGFSKGGYNNNIDASINDTVIRECFEETSIKLDISKLIDTEKLYHTRDNKKYALFLYELSTLEYESIHNEALLEKKNADYENELHNIKFMRIPKMNLKKFFINTISRETYIDSIDLILKRSNGGKRKYTRRVNSKLIKKANIYTIKTKINSTPIR